MAARVSDADVRAIVESDSSISLQPVIQAANLLTNRTNTCAGARGVTLTSAELFEIERNLAAHFYGARDHPYQSKSEGGASASFQWQSGMHLEGTRHGQIAMDLDVSGCLRAYNMGARARMDWLGTLPETTPSDRGEV